jgi:predicted hydrocarbon binding protein
LLSSIDLDLENKRAIVVVNNSAVGSVLKGKVKAPCDHFMRGIIAAIFWDFFNEEVDCVESECIAMADSKCKFVVKLPHEFDFSKENVKQQLSAE